MTRAVAAAGAVLLTTLAVAPPAEAEVKVVHDKAGDGSNGAGSSGPRKWGDIGKVRIKHGHHAVRLTVLPAKGGQLGDFYDFWVDTNPKNRGPEYVGTVSLEVVPNAWVARTDTFGHFGKESCRVKTAGFDRDTQTVKVVFPRTCFGRPRRLRVSTHSSMEYESADWAPARHVFGPWVKRG